MASSRFRDWLAYKKAFALSSSIHRMLAYFPKHERYNLCDQMSRSSSSVCANLAECYGRRGRPKYFQAKLEDCITENLEVQVWFDMALDRNYINREQYERYIEASEEVGKLLTYMKRNPQQFMSRRK